MNSNLHVVGSVLQRFFPQVTTFLWVTILLPACGPSASTGPEIQVENAWARPVVALGEHPQDSGKTDMNMGQDQGSTGAVFFRLLNTGGESDRLVGAQTDVAAVAEIHETRMDGEVMNMQHLPDGLEIPANEEVRFEPGGYHIMLIGVSQELKAGDRFAVDLQFAKTGVKTIEVQVR